MEKISREEILAMYKPDVERLVYYLPWLEKKSGSDVATTYHTENKQAIMPFPVYEETMLVFLNDLSCTVFMDQNYRYIYSRYRIHDYEDELRMIDKADIMTMDILKGILSKYMLGGMTKAHLWTEGMVHQIFLRAIMKAKEIVEFWDVPLNVPMMELYPAAEEEMKKEFEYEQPEESMAEEEYEQLEESVPEEEYEHSEAVAAEEV